MNLFISKSKSLTQSAGFEPTRAEPNWFLVNLLNHSDMTAVSRPWFHWITQKWHVASIRKSWGCSNTSNVFLNFDDFLELYEGHGSSFEVEKRDNLKQETSCGRLFWGFMTRSLGVTLEEDNIFHWKSFVSRVGQCVCNQIQILPYKCEPIS